ncbi:MAG: LytTR family DNA-binding domain-containing protein [Leptospirales bacterium]|nr:LytTR family DNA-binding domain-containing protein [Leptospirales bacterium]
MNVLICDDMKAEVDRLAALINETGLDIMTVTFTDSRKALDYVGSGAVVDACFLDIVMPEMDGIALAGKLRENGYKGEIVFLTTSNEFAHQSYRVQAFDYLLKPPTLKSVTDILLALKNSRNNADKDGILVKTHGATSFILFRDISYVKVIKHKVYIWFLNGDGIAVYTTFSETAERLLSDSRFVQCHRSYIVNVSEITTVSERQVVMRCGAKIPIARGMPSVKDKMMKRMFMGNKENEYG